jgi:hypothetical protein
MPTTITGTTITYSPAGTVVSTAPTIAAVGGNYSIGYAQGTYILTAQVNPKTPQAYVNTNVEVNGTAGFLIPWPTWYWPYVQGGGPYYNNGVTGFITSVSSVVNFPATNTNYYAIPGVWRASGWLGDGNYIDEQYFYQLFRRVA